MVRPSRLELRSVNKTRLLLPSVFMTSMLWVPASQKYTSLAAEITTNKKKTHDISIQLRINYSL